MSLPVLLFFNLSVTSQMDCRSAEYKQELIRKTPGLAVKLQEIESFTRQQFSRRSATTTMGIGNNGTTENSLAIFTIPVVVHILYNSTNQNISDGQVLSQFAALNRDYRRLNTDTVEIPFYYKSHSADCGIRFALATLDPSGSATTGIIHKHTNVLAFDINDNIKITAKGGDDAWDRDNYLNIWVGNLSDGVIGYSSTPGTTKTTDGVTILYTAFGTTGAARVPFNLGRTASHEIGHWLNLVHTWGDADCGNDYVDDTPQQQAATRGNPRGIRVSCGNGPYGDMYMDYMDFTDDLGMHMFTYGQRDRMRVLFAEGGPRNSILNSNALSGPSILPAITAGLPADGNSGQLFRIYPNPSFNSILVAIDKSRLGSLLEVYDQAGQKMMSARLADLSYPLNISSLSNGIYFIRVNDGKQKSMAKLVKL